MKTQKQNEKLLLVLGIAVAVLLGANSLVWFSRLDLTQNKAYSVSQTSQNYFKSLDEPIRITYYVSPVILNKISQIQNIADLVEEFAYSSSGKVQVRIRQVDSEKDKEEMQSKGIQSQQYQVVDENEMSVVLVYSGIQVEYLNRSKVIPFIADPANLEYQLSLVMRGLVADKLPAVGILVGKPDYDPGSQLKLLTRYFGESYELRTLKSGDVIPPDLAFLFVMGDETLTEVDAQHIDAFIMNGKNAVIGLDTIGVDIGNSLEPRAFKSGPVQELVKNYGVEVKHGWVLDPYNAKLPIQKNVRGMVYEMQEAYAPWVRMASATLNQTDPIMEHLPFLDVLWASPLEYSKDAQNIVLLASSSPDAFLLDAPQNADPYMMQNLLKDGSKERKSLPLAVIIKSGLNSPYKGISSPAKTDKAQVIVLGDSDFASDLIQVSQSTGNMDFLRNIFETFGYDQELMSLRNREIQNARLDKISDKASKNLIITVAQVINIGVIPCAVVIFGLVRLMQRRHRAGQSLKSTGAES